MLSDVTTRYQSGYMYYSQGFIQDFIIGRGEFRGEDAVDGVATPFVLIVCKDLVLHTCMQYL